MKINLIYNFIIIPIGVILYFPFFIKKLIQRGIGKGNFGERFGIFSKEKQIQLAKYKAPIWIHAVSVGEVIVAINFIKSWQKRRSDLNFVLSSTTTTGQTLAHDKAPSNVIVIFSPLDLKFSVRSALKKIKPSMLIIFEVEIWPNIITMVKESSIKLALINCRMSDNSAKGYKRFKYFFKEIFNAFDLICTQSHADAEKIETIIDKNNNIFVCNTMKFDQIADIDTSNKVAYLDEIFGEKIIILTAASTHAREESMIIDIFITLKSKYPKLKLILTPRHCERCTEVEKLLLNTKLTYRKYINDTNKDTKVDVLLVNTTGELMNFIAVSDIVYVGKSMCGNFGGHNIIEPALFGKAIIYGPEMQNFTLVASIFEKNNASIKVQDKEDLLNNISKLISSPDLAIEYGKQALKVVKNNRGAVKASIDKLESIM